MAYATQGIDLPFSTLTPLTALLYTAPVPSSSNLSPSTHRSMIFAPSTSFGTSALMTLFTMSAAAYTPQRKILRKIEDRDLNESLTLYLVMSASAVGRGFSAAGTSAGLGSVSDIMCGEEG